MLDFDGSEVTTGYRLLNVVNPRKTMFSFLHQRLEEALQHGSEVRIRLANCHFYGVPIRLDSEFVEILNLFVDEGDANSMCERSVWLIKISEIVAFSYPIESWTKDRLEALVKDPEASNVASDVASDVSSDMKDNP